MLDTILLTCLEVKRLKSESAYWLQLIGFEHNSSCIYQVYVTGFWLFWVFTMWAFLIDQVENLSHQVALQDVTTWLDSLPILVLFLQLLYFLSLLFDSPLKLMAPDLSYVAASPVSRGAITLVHFFRTLLVPAIVLALLGTLVALFFAWGLAASHVEMIGFQAFFVTFALVYLSGALGWTTALTWQNRRTTAGKVAFGVVVILAPLLGSLAIPGLALWPGTLWAACTQDSLRVMDVLLLIGALAAAWVGLYITGSWTNMTVIMDHSSFYARIQKLGLVGRLMAADVVTRIRNQSRLAKKSRFRNRLPETFDTPCILFGQTYLVVTRLSPGISVRLVLAGITFTSLAISLVMIGETSSVQTWVLLFVLLLQFRLNEVMRLYRAQVQQPFLRQFLPENNLLLFTCQTSLPLLLMSVGVSLAVLMQPWVKSVAVLILAVGVLLALALSQALETVRFRYYALPYFCYEYAVIFFGLLVVGSGYLLHSVWAAFMTIVMVDLLLALLLYHSTSVQNPRRP